MDWHTRFYGRHSVFTYVYKTGSEANPHVFKGNSPLVRSCPSKSNARFRRNLQFQAPAVCELKSHRFAVDGTHDHFPEWFGRVIQVLLTPWSQVVVDNQYRRVVINFLLYDALAFDLCITGRFPLKF